jgi:hypothetical protein
MQMQSPRKQMLLGWSCRMMLCRSLGLLQQQHPSTTMMISWMSLKTKTKSLCRSCCSTGSWPPAAAATDSQRRQVLLRQHLVQQQQRGLMGRALGLTVVRMSHLLVMMTRLTMTVIWITSRMQRKICQGGSHLMQIRPLLLLLPLALVQLPVGHSPQHQHMVLPATQALPTQQQQRPLLLLLHLAAWMALQWGRWMQMSRHSWMRSLLHCCRSCCLLARLLMWPWQQ